MPDVAVDLKALISEIHEEVEKTLASSFCDPDAEAFAGSVLALVDAGVAKSAAADGASAKRIGYPYVESRLLFFGRELRKSLMSLYDCGIDDIEMVPYTNDELLEHAKSGDFEYLVGRLSEMEAVVDSSAQLVSITIPRTFKDASAVPPLPGM